MEREEVIKEPYGVTEPSYSYPVSRIGWGAVIAGFFIATVTQILLNALGVAIGLSAVDPQMEASGRAIGMGAGIWTLITTLISVFIGAWWPAGILPFVREEKGRCKGCSSGRFPFSFLFGLLRWASAPP